MTWRVIDLGYQEPWMTQTLYEAVAVFVSRGIVPNTLLIVNPASPYVCVGYHQDPERELDLDYCREKRYPLIRRSQGGGAVYLDRNQFFYQVVAKTGEVPADVTELFRSYLQAPIAVLKEYGITAEFKPVNDVLANQRKISGNGAGVIDDATVMVGNILLDVNTAEMARVLRVPSEKFRDKIAAGIGQWVTGLQQELGFIPPRHELAQKLTRNFAKILGPLEPGEITPEEHRYWTETTRPQHQSKEWLFLPIQARKEAVSRKLKVYSNLRVVEAEHKASKLIRVTASIRLPDDDTETPILEDVIITGDFFLFPDPAIRAIEESLQGVPLRADALTTRITRFFRADRVQASSITPEDLITVLMKLISTP